MGIFGSNVGPQMPFPMNRIHEFKNFLQTFQGDPQQQFQQMLNTGQVTPEQYSKLQMMYQQFGQFFR